MSEVDAASIQMGRPLDGRRRVVSRCGLGLPVVLEVEPDRDGAPFPTLYYLTCPLARARVSRLEQVGVVREMTARIEADPAFAAAFAESTAAYVQRRAELIPPGSPVGGMLQGGVGGSRGGVKCLHAHFAHLRAGGPNPVGEAIRDRVEPLECAVPCVSDGARNPRWQEPPLTS